MLVRGSPHDLTLMAKIRMARKGSARALLRACRIKKSAYGGDTIGRKTDALGVFMDGCLVRGEVDAIHLVAGYVTMQPLDCLLYTSRCV